MSKMKIIAHRGYWLKPKEKNTALAFRRALEHDFGIETDFRDLNGVLVVSHDPPTAGAMLSYEFIEIYKQYPTPSPLALNIKADGLHSQINEFCIKANLKNYFVFDMAVPDMRIYLQSDIPTFTRLSEFEREAIFFDRCSGVWLDAFTYQWYSADTINELLCQNKKVVLVSPELHGRPYLPLWEMLKCHMFHHRAELAICTDFPLDARNYFHGQN